MPAVLIQNETRFEAGSHSKKIKVLMKAADKSSYEKHYTDSNRTFGSFDKRSSSLDHEFSSSSQRAGR